MLVKEKKIGYILKRNGQRQPIDIQKIYIRLQGLAKGLDHAHINIHHVVRKVIEGMY